MSKLNYELTLYHSPYHDTLVEELSSLIKQKKSIYRNIHSEKEFRDKLSFEEREILKHLIAKEDEILHELIKHKGWLFNSNKEETSRLNSTSHKNYSDEDEDNFIHSFGY